MKYLFLVSLLVISACNQQGMSDEHRQKIIEEAKDREIQRLTDADILNMAKTMALEVYETAEKGKYSSTLSIDNIKWIDLRDTLANSYEREMQEAYQYSVDQGLALHENIEEVEGIILFAKPEVVSDSFRGFWLVSLDKKAVIKELR